MFDREINIQVVKKPDLIGSDEYGNASGDDTMIGGGEDNCIGDWEWKWDGVGRLEIVAMNVRIKPRKEKRRKNVGSVCGGGWLVIKMDCSCDDMK
jgi:hypothetical protein